MQYIAYNVEKQLLFSFGLLIWL